MPFISQDAYENDVFDVPRLNASQEQGASKFLRSTPGSVTIIQGPPGTGKTTLLVNIICRYLMESVQTTAPMNPGSCPNGTANPTPRILVCAPTNKAVSVLAARFIKATKDDSAFNILLVGDGAKLLQDEESNKGSGRNSQINLKREDAASNGDDETSSTARNNLHSIYIYDWMSTLIKEYVERSRIPTRQVYSPRISR